ncbi:MAG TPA: aldolase [Edaphobacter sp.]|nr:aldolase [Edaphobacter sp.]
MTIQEIERTCDQAQPLEFSRHELQTEELLLQKTFFPFGFPVEVKTNSENVLGILEEVWGYFTPQYETKPVCSEIHVVEAGDDECPVAPLYRIMPPYLMSVADGNNYSIVDFERGTASVSISDAALRRKAYASYFLLSAPVSCIATRYATPVHAACVALDGHGVLLCGDSGAGKSTLSYACARKGWTYVSDDASFLVNGESSRMVAGNCHQVRFRPEAVQFFPEIEGLELTPRAAGKPSVEMLTNRMPNLICEQTAKIDYIVFLNRRGNSEPQLMPYRKDVARYFMRQVLFGLPETMAVQYQAIEKLLTAEVLELRYRNLDWAIERLRVLVQEGH